LFVYFHCAKDEVLMRLGGMGVAGQPGVMTNGMMGMAPQMMPSMQVSICYRVFYFAATNSQQCGLAGMIEYLK